MTSSDSEPTGDRAWATPTLGRNRTTSTASGSRTLATLTE